MLLTGMKMNLIENPTNLKIKVIESHNSRERVGVEEKEKA